jgi:hypothetical protein
MRSRTVYLLHVAFAVLLLSAAGPAQAISIVINNGLAPPNPGNVINDATYSGDVAVYVRNAGCPPAWPNGGADLECPSPGAPTAVALVQNGAVGGNVEVRDSSTLTMSGGAIGNQLKAYDDSTITLSGGTVMNRLEALNSSTITMSDGYVGENLDIMHSSTFTMTGGTVDNEVVVGGSASFTMSGGEIGGELHATNTAVITIVGYGFEVNGSPAPYGDLTVQTGTLTGTLASREPIDTEFHQGGGLYTGTITLAPPGYLVVPALSRFGYPALVCCLTGFGLVGLAVGRRRSGRSLYT